MKPTMFFLITGFLGAGKTSFLKNILPMCKDQSIRIIINDFGKVGLDATLLDSYKAELTEIVDGSIFCACRIEEFEQAIADCLKAKPDLLFVETSGLSNPQSIRNILSKYECNGILRYSGTVCLVDAQQFHKAFATVCNCIKQLAISDLVLINKCDLVTTDELYALEKLLGEICPAKLIRTTNSVISMDKLMSINVQSSTMEADARPDLTLQKEAVEICSSTTLRELRHFISLVCSDTFRIKGIASIQEGTYLVDCIGIQLTITPYFGSLAKQNAIVLLAGQGMSLRKSLQDALKLFPGKLRRMS